VGVFAVELSPEQRAALELCLRAGLLQALRARGVPEELLPPLPHGR